MRPQFVLSEMAGGLRRNLSMTVSLVLVTMVSFTFLGLGTLSLIQSSDIKTFWYGKVEVWISLCPVRSEVASCSQGEVTEAQKAELSSQLESLRPLVEKVYFESKDEAYQHFVEQFKDSAIRDTVKPEQMQESFRVKLSDPKKYDVVASAFQGAPGVERVIDQRKLLSTLFTFLNLMTYTGIGFAVVTTLAAALLVATTVRLSVFSRRREIGIMRLVGASNLFIQLPFILEAVLATVIGTVLASGLLFGFAQFFLQGWLSPKMRFIPFISVQDVLLVTPFLLAVAILVSVATSMLAMQRHLRI
jgi:cell division transport system permease protein